MYWEVWVLFSEVQLLCLNSGLGINLPGKVPRSAVWDPEWFWPMAGRQKDSHTSHSAYRVPTSAPKGRVDQWGTWPVKCDVEVGIPFPLPVMWPWTRYLKSQSSVSSLTKENKNWCFLKGLLWRVNEAVCIKCLDLGGSPWILVNCCWALKMWLEWGAMIPSFLRIWSQPLVLILADMLAYLLVFSRQFLIPHQIRFCSIDLSFCAPVCCPA